MRPELKKRDEKQQAQAVAYASGPSRAFASLMKLEFPFPFPLPPSIFRSRCVAMFSRFRILLRGSQNGQTTTVGTVTGTRSTI